MDSEFTKYDFSDGLLPSIMARPFDEHKEANKCDDGVKAAHIRHLLLRLDVISATSIWLLPTAGRCSIRCCST